MKLNFLDKVLLPVNFILLTVQLILMGTFGGFFTFPLFNLLVPIIAFVNLVFVSYWLIKLKWPVFIFIFSLLIGFSEWGMLYKLPNNAVQVSKGLKVMSFNVRLFNRYKWIKSKDIPQEISSFIKTESPDIFCLQEFAREQSPKFPDYPYRFIEPSLNKAQNGLSIFSKFPLINNGVIKFDNSNNGAIYSDIVYEKDTLRMYNIHLESLRLNISDTLFSQEHSLKFKNRIEQVILKQQFQLKEFEKVDKTNSYPAIVCTDLNNNAFSEVYNSLNKNLKDLFVETGGGLGATYKVAYFPFRIDFIFANPKFELINFKTHQESLSDHNPISAIIDWK